jgi:hypothetical protein
MNLMFTTKPTRGDRACRPKIARKACGRADMATPSMHVQGDAWHRHTIHNQLQGIRPAQGSREATPSSDGEAPSDVTAHCAEEGIKGGNKTRKQHLQGTMTTTNHDDGHNWEVGGSGVRCISATARSGKRLVRSPTDHFKRLLEEACPNHAYLVRHNLKDCSMMRSFMTLGFFTWCVELDEGSNRSDMTLFREENAIMTIYGGRRPSGRHRLSSLSPRAPTHCGWGRGGSRV